MSGPRRKLFQSGTNGGLKFKDASKLKQARDYAMQEKEVDRAKGNSVSNERFGDHRLENMLVDMENSKTHRHKSIGSFFGKKDSEQYVAVKNAIRSVLVYAKVPFKDESRENLTLVKNMSNAYFKLIDACEAYLEKEGGKSASGYARKVMVKSVLDLAREDIVAVTQCYHNIYTRKISDEDQEKLNWNDIIHAAREATIEVEDYNKIATLGAANKSGDAASRDLDIGIFTPENIIDMDFTANGDVSKAQNDFSANACPDAGGLMGEKFKGQKIQVNQSNRNVATSRVAQLLGIGGIVEESKNVNVVDKKTGQTKKGILMSRAKGKEAKKVYANLADNVTQKLDSIQARSDMVERLFAPSVQKELCSLQVLDYLCAQGDRNRGNYFLEYDKEKQQYTHVHGIDNDLSFGYGSNNGEIVYRRKGNVSSHSKLTVDHEGNLAIPHMDKQLAENILNLRPEILEFELKGLIEPDFIVSALERLEKLQEAIRREKQKENKPGERKVLLDDHEWGKETHKEFLEKSMAYKLREGADENEFYKSKSQFSLGAEERYNANKEETYYAVAMLEAMAYKISMSGEQFAKS